MREDFREALIAWRDRPKFASEQRNIQISKVPFAGDNCSIKISMTEIIRFKQASTKVEVIAKMLTIAQDEPSSKIGGQPYPNPRGDIYRFNTIAANLEVQFWTKREEELTRIIEEEMPDGFLNFNDL